ncbi:hypothetical protein C8F04DRAFT_1328872, partial [Mycena alexandri]
LAVDEITHVVSTTCTNSSNPGFDVFLAQEPNRNWVLPSLHGVGVRQRSCGSVPCRESVLLVSCHLAQRNCPALVAACEITSSMRRDELERISRDQEIRIGVTLFRDGASALIPSFNPEGGVFPKLSKGIYELVNWMHLTVPDTHSDLRIDVDASGFKATLSAYILSLTAPLLLRSCTTLPNKSAMPTLPSEPQDFDWAVHPEGAVILSAIQTAMNINKDEMKAIWEVYENDRNTSSVTVLSVLDTLRMQPGRE